METATKVVGGVLFPTEVGRFILYCHPALKDRALGVMRQAMQESKGTMRFWYHLDASMPEKEWALRGPLESWMEPGMNRWLIEVK